MAKIIELWESYCLGKTNIIYERYVFNKKNQQEGETVETYTSTLRSLAVRDRFVCGVRNNGMGKKLLQVPEQTLDKCLDICRSAETTSTQAVTGQSEHAPLPLR